MKEGLINKIRKTIESNGLMMFAEASGINPVKLINDCGLSYKTFDDIEFNWVEHLGGVKSITLFDNGYGVSVIKHDASYGGKQGLYELTVLKDGDICYDSYKLNGKLYHRILRRDTPFL